MGSPVSDHGGEAVAEIDLAAVDGIVGGEGKGASSLVPILQAIQRRFGYLPRQALERVCETTEIAPAQLCGVASFYNQFRMRPAGRHTVRVCVGTACHVMGADSVWAALRRELAIPEGADTDSGRVFTVERVACLGCCMLAPAVQIDDVTYGPVRPEAVAGVLRDFLQARAAPEPAPAAGEAPGAWRGEIRLCLCSSCSASGARAVIERVRRELRSLGVRAGVSEVGCTGMAYQAPVMEIVAGGRSFRYGRVAPERVRSILERHFLPTWGPRRLRGKARELLLRLRDGTAEPVTRFLLDSEADAAFLRPQHPFATSRSGELDPLDLDAYLRADGFQAARRCLTELTPSEIVEAVRASGLRGRGGAGFPTALKWERVRDAPWRTTGS